MSTSKYTGGPPTLRNRAGRDINTDGSPTRKSIKADFTAAAQRRNSVVGTEKARMESSSGRETSRNKMRAQREGMPGPELERLNNRRAARIKSKDFKGKYYGPDEFKGNLSILKAWRKAGSPNASKFMKDGRGG
jgi:hypothetical protein